MCARLLQEEERKFEKNFGWLWNKLPLVCVSLCRVGSGWDLGIHSCIKKTSV